MKDKALKIRLWMLAGAFVAIAVGFRAMLFSHLPGVFSAPEEDLSFGWYVPLFSLYVLWTEREKLRRSFGSPSAWALPWLLPVLFVGLLGARGLQVRFELLAFVALLVLVPWAIFGRETAKRVLFPALFLLFCLPLASFLSLITVHLRILVSAMASGILSGFGMEIARQGNVISLPDLIVDGQVFVIDIANPCSGLRSIFALMALSAGYGYFAQPTWWRRGVLFALAIPLAIVGNVMRIMSICVVAKAWDPAFAIGTYHDLSGYLVFLVALGLLIVASGGLDRLCVRKGESARSEADASPGDVAAGSACGRRAFAVPAVVLALLVPVMAYQALTPDPIVQRAPSAALPETLSVGGADYVGVPVAPSAAETNLLVGATLSKRTYVPADQVAADVGTSRRLAELEAQWLKLEAERKASGGRASLEAERRAVAEEAGRLAHQRDAIVAFAASTVVSGANKGSLHRPELCLPSHGFEMGESRTLRVGDLDWRLIPLHEKGGRPASLFAYTFFNQDGYRTDSHVARIWRDVWDRCVFNRADRWAMVTVMLNEADERRLAAALESLRGLIR